MSKPEILNGGGGGGGQAGLPAWNILTASDFAYVSDTNGLRDPVAGGTALEWSGSVFSFRLNRAASATWWQRWWLHQGPTVGDLGVDLEDATKAKVLQIRLYDLTFSGFDGTVQPSIIASIANSGNVANRGAGIGVRNLADQTQRIYAGTTQQVDSIGAQTWGPTNEDFPAGTVEELVGTYHVNGERTAKAEVYAYSGAGTFLVNKGTWAFNQDSPTRLYLAAGHISAGGAGNTEITGSIAWRAWDPRTGQ